MQWIKDWLLEIRIKRARNRLINSTCSLCKRMYAKKMADLIALRSPHRVAEMERKMGLQ